jgi:hypothetical protein
MNSAFYINFAPFAQKLVADFGKLSPSYNIMEVGGLLPFALGSCPNPVCGQTKACHSAPFWGVAHLRIPG